MGSCSCSQGRESCCYSEGKPISRQRDAFLTNDVDLEELPTSKPSHAKNNDLVVFDEVLPSSGEKSHNGAIWEAGDCPAFDNSPPSFKFVDGDTLGELCTQACTMTPNSTTPATSETQATISSLITSGKIDDARRLIASCQDINVEDSRRCTPLHTAIICDQQDIARMLVERRANLGGLDLNGQSPLHLAATHGHVEIASLLVGCGLGVNARDTRSGRSPLHSAASNRSSNVAMITFLLEQHAEIDAVDERYNVTPLHEAVSSCCLERVELLCKNKASISTSDASGRLPLHKAASAGGAKIATLLINSQASVHEKDSKCGYTPLHLAVIGGHAEVSQILLERGARRDAKTKNGRIPIQFARNRNDAKLTELFERRFFPCSCVR